MERTLVLVKPDGVQRGLVGEVVARLERKGLKIVALKMIQMDKALAKRHYGVHEGKPFFEGLVKFITSGPIVAAVLEGPGAVAAARSIMGATDPIKATPGTVRGDLAMSIGMNVVHGSDAPETAAKEISLFFTEKEIISYKRVDEPWVIES